MPPGLLLALMGPPLLFGCERPVGTGTETVVNANRESPIEVDAAHTSRNALDWPGTYSGTLPCAVATIRPTDRANRRHTGTQDSATSARLDNADEYVGEPGREQLHH